MPTLDEIFYKDFKRMSKMRESMSGNLNINSLNVPTFKSNTGGERMVYINGISEEYYSELNGSAEILLVKPKLCRRRFASNGSFLKDKKTGEVLTDDVTVPHDCVAILSRKSIHVPLKFQPKGNFQYVDYVSRNKVRYFIYIIPKKYCYKLEQCALCIGLRRNVKGSYYCCMEVVLQSGHTVYISVIPYKGSTAESYRVICTKPSKNFDGEIKQLMQMWLQNRYVYPVKLTALSMPVNGVSNVAYHSYDAILSDFEAYSPDKSLADDKTEFSLGDDAT